MIEKKNVAPPNYGDLRDAMNRATDTANKLGTRMLDFSERQYEEMSPLARRAADQQFAAQAEQMGMAREDRERYLSTFAPVEQGLVRRAQEFDTDAYREQMASQAAADAARAFGTTQGMTSRNLSRMGVGPNSGAAMSQMNQNALGLASMRAGAMTGSRLQSEGEGMNRLYNAAALGRGLPGQTLGAYGGAVGAGSAGVQTAMAPGNQYMQGMGQGASTIMQGQGLGMQGATSILGNQANLYGQSMNAQAELTGAILGAGTGLGAAGIAKYSDRRLKENIELVGRDERTMLPLYEFEYKGGDGRRFLGVMADDVEKVFPQAVIEMSNGYKAVDYDLLGIEMVEV
jgi:hypothetical protein